MKFKLLFLLVLTFWITHAVVYGQRSQSLIRKSPLGMEIFKEDSLYIKFTYSRMNRQKKVVFGGIVPYKKLWRLGDDEAPEITLTRSVYIENHFIPAGTYTLFAIPDTSQWTLVINKEPGQYGLFKYDPKKDLCRINLPLYRSPKNFDDFTCYIDTTQTGIDIVMIWESTVMRIPIHWKP
ncbi:MAG: DUF2911 domain-containing protein [Cytophagales bacterium]|nr:DUF2911 domain-containing protein [Cytophagales bacterium]MDW8383179.1 DUF2911 domain-containing protein [Flammeovirgaceae bacterium]